MLTFIPRSDGTCAVMAGSMEEEPIGDIIIPEYSPDGYRVAHISYEAFASCTRLTSVTIPKSVTRIGNGAFMGCKNLKSIILPDGIKRIGMHTFRGCHSLENITIPKSVMSIGDSAFYGCIGLKNINLQSGVMSIGDVAFYRCSNLRNIFIPDTVKSIGEYTFFECTRLASINIPDSVVKIGRSAFNKTALSKLITVKATNENMTCREFQYEIGKWYHLDNAALCECGFHYVKNVFDVFNYYYGKIGDTVRFFKVKTKGTSRKRGRDSKRVCTDICLYEEITSYKDLLS